MRPAALCVIVLALCSVAIGASEPEVDSIDYSKPDKYLAIPACLGNATAIREQAAKLKGPTELDTIRNVFAWIGNNLTPVLSLPKEWRTYDDLVRDKTYYCPEKCVVCAALLQGAGIPIVWVKSMELPWIWDLKAERPWTTWYGYTYLEVCVDRKWALLDPSGEKIYQRYSPKTRILPGQRFAYHKGSDPKAMILSCQWEPWKEQTLKYFHGLDESLLPVDERSAISLRPRVDITGKSPGQFSAVRVAYVVGNSPYYQAISQMAMEMGLEVAASFNTHYDQYLPRAKGHVLLIEMHGGKPIVPAETLARHYPGALAGAHRPSRSIRIDGTSIVFVEFPEKP